MPTMQGRPSAQPRPSAIPRSSEIERSLAIRCDSEAPGAVRDALRDFGQAGWILGDAMLIASELVSNAVLHSGAHRDDLLHVDLRFAEEGVLFISVTDPGVSGGTAEPRSADDAFGGIGLRVVEQLATRWGSDRRDGHRVWAELAAPPAR
jgi:anti-sigma regulatory factor (Ser/Thr protein kinase)